MLANARLWMLATVINDEIGCAASSPVVHHYFVDEAGDFTLFDKHGRAIVGQQGVSRVLMVGVAHLPDVERVGRELASLRAEIPADPYFKGVPSLQPEWRKTALHFHAKDDLPEVRREVFKLLPRFGAKVQIAVRRKSTLVEDAKTLHRRGRKLRPDDVYDDLTKRLFKNLLHQADENQIVFAHRGKVPRYEALESAIAKAKRNFEIKTGKPSDRPTAIRSAYPRDCPGLQVVDYYLWALIRLFERREDRYFAALASDYRLIMDLDDKRRSGYGEWYSSSNPLSLDKIAPLVG